MGERLLSSLLVFFFAICFTDACSKDELVMVQTLSRHGSIAPPELYPNDPNSEAVWKEGRGGLTMLGKFQPYIIGSLLRTRYEGFITSDPKEVEVLSCERPDCMKSTLSYVAALYAPTPEWEIVRGFPWQPIIVRYIADSDDKYLGSLECPKADREFAQVSASEEAQNHISEYRSLFDLWTNKSGWQISDWDSAASLFRVLKVESDFNLTVPTWARETWNEMEYTLEHFYRWSFKTKLLQRLRGGPLVDLVVDKLKNKALGTLEDKKVFVYTTHAYNVAAFLSALNVFNGLEPPFSATVIIELYKHRLVHYVRMLYFNSTIPEKEPQVLYLLTLEGCSEFCPLEYFVNYAASSISSNWEGECQNGV